MPKPAFSKQALKRARQRLTRQGMTVRAWAQRHHFSESTVYEVLGGRKRCLYGEAHRAAVLLGLKKGVISVSPVTQSETH